MIGSKWTLNWILLPCLSEFEICALNDLFCEESAFTE